MRTRFWRKRNAKLDKRLNTVIETTERARKSIQRPPSRVTIDTSYLDMVAQDVGDTSDDQQPYFDGADEVDQDFAGVDDPATGEAGGSAAAMYGASEVLADAASEACEPSALLQADIEGETAQPEQMVAALLRRAEEAERELEAVFAAADQQEQAARETYEALQTELAARRAAEEARDAMARRVEETEGELSALRARLESYEENAHSAAETLEREAEARRSIEAERDGLATRLEDAEAKLASLVASAKESDDRLSEMSQSLADETVARVAVEAARNELARKLESAEAELQSVQAAGAAHEARHRELEEARDRETAARQTAEAELQEARTRLEASVAEVAQLRTTLAERDLALKEAEAAAQRELGARLSLQVDLDDALRKAETAASEVAQLRQAAEADKSAVHEAIELDRDALMRRAEEAERRLAELSAAAESHEVRLREAAEAQHREVVARQAAESERDEWARRAAETETDVAALKRALAEKPAEVVSAATVAPVQVATLQPTAEAPEAEAQPEPAPPAKPEVRAEDERIKDVLRSRLARKGLSIAEAPAAGSAEPRPATESQAVTVPELTSKPNEAGAPASGAAANRRDRRVASQMPATLWREGMGQPLACTLRDRSPSGARVEFRHASIIDGFSAFNVGDQATLTLNSAHEKTWVGCEVVWVDGNSCGVRFLGQFRSESPAVRKSTRNTTAEKPRAKSGSRLASVFSLKG